ncbi:hypothetical protein MBLNU13_g05416t1 [Cladosporium sp. NU13]
MVGDHTGVSIAKQIHRILTFFSIAPNFGYAIADNASENTACINHLSEVLHIDLDKRRIMCIGHVINLVAQECLWGSDVAAFEEGLENVTAEQLELIEWRRRGPIGKLHNLIRYICHSSKRRDLFSQIQRIQRHRLEQSQTVESAALPPFTVYELVHDNLTQWNSWYDAAVRATKLRSAIDEFIDSELGDYNAAQARYAGSHSLTKRPPKKPSLLDDVLSADDWHIITKYVALLQPLKQATMQLQGHINTTAARNKPVKGAIWQVLPIFENIMATFEEARQQHLPAETLRSQRSQRLSTSSTAPSPLLTTPAPAPLRVTRSSQSIPITRSSAPTNTFLSQTKHIVSEEQLHEPDVAKAASTNESQVHFSTNINLAWQKANQYYTKTDDSPIYRAAVVLHPRLKWRWFDRYWANKPEWRENAKEAVQELWEQYKHLPADEQTNPSSPTAIRDEWSTTDEADASNDQFKAYLDELWAQVHLEQSLIPYWISKVTVWPQLAKMALDVYSTPACSDEPERVFSSGRALLTPRRRMMTGDHVQEALCLRSWQDCGIIHLGPDLFDEVIRYADGAPISEQISSNNIESDDEV